jgi:hypothetical protein
MAGHSCSIYGGHHSFAIFKLNLVLLKAGVAVSVGNSKWLSQGNH